MCIKTKKVALMIFTSWHSHMPSTPRDGAQNYNNSSWLKQRCKQVQPGRRSTNGIQRRHNVAMLLLFVNFRAVASGDLRWQEFEEDRWIDYVKCSHDFVGLIMSPLFLLY